MRHIAYYFFLTLLILFKFTYVDGFAAGTLVKTPSGYTSIEQLKKGDLVVSFNINKNRLENKPVISVIKKHVSIFYTLTTDRTVIVADPQQRFYAHDNTWVIAEKITTDMLLRTLGRVIAVSDNVRQESPIAIYELEIDDLHTFCITHDDIIVHNNIIVLSAGFLFGAGIEFFWKVGVPLVALTGTAIALFLDKVKNKNKPMPLFDGQKKHDGRSGPGPEDPDEEKKHPHGTYEDAPYHTAKGNKIKSPRPTNGQKALDNSLKIEDVNSPHRIALSDGEFVVLRKTSDKLYHGHVRSWEQLSQPMRKTLLKARLVTQKGKPI